ncbi:MAG: hypothetical protein M3352_02770 [Bacteroidota bacterium]|nr:hypothetical protein [Bacteroidota bacterium]
MARLFSIQFDYQGIGYNAMVTVRTTPFFTEYQLSMLDEEVLNQLPDKRILSSSPMHYVFASHNSNASKDLMNEILRSIADHVQAIV